MTLCHGEQDLENLKKQIQLKEFKTEAEGKSNHNVSGYSISKSNIRGDLNELTNESLGGEMRYGSIYVR